MLTIGQFADKAKVSTRTVRYYESIGLLPKSNRGENNYRFYSTHLIERMNRIQDLQSLGFSLENIKIIIGFSDSELKIRLTERLKELEAEIDNLKHRKIRIQELLSVSNKIETGEFLTETERNLYMNNIREEILSGLRNRYNGVDDTAITYLKRDTWLDAHPQVNEFLASVKKCMDFAKENHLTLGSPRGSAAASISFFGLGYSSIDPLKYKMIPERLSTRQPFFHIDVEFANGQKFVDFCKDINKSLTYGEIQAFKMPLIDTVQNTHRSIGQAIDYYKINDDSDLVLSPFKNKDLEKIFQFDFSADALVMNFEKFFPEYFSLEKINEHFNNQNFFSFRDIINITALWRPYTQQIVDRIALYQQAKSKPFSYGFLSKNIEHWLEPNFGLIIYHEDIVKIISEYSGWDFARCNILRRKCMQTKSITTLDQDIDWIEFQKLAPQKVADLVAEESKWSFCMPHAISFSKFTKQTAVLKSLHKNAYFSEIEKFEQKHGFRWDDIGIKIKGVSLLQS